MKLDIKEALTHTHNAVSCLYMFITTQEIVKKKRVGGANDVF